MNRKLAIALNAALIAAANGHAFAQSMHDNLPSRQDSYIEEGSVSRSANPVQQSSIRDRLPKTIHGPVVGMPGDSVSQGFRAPSAHQTTKATRVTFSGKNVILKDEQQAGTVSSMLPPVRSSPYIDGYGDHVRSDLGMRINGMPYRKPILKPSGTSLNAQQPQRQTGVFKYGDPVTPPYKRSH